MTSRLRAALVAIVVGLLAGGLATATSPADAASSTGAAGTDTAIAPTDSAVTVPGRGEFSSLRVSVNQTKNLINQAVSVTWTGGVPTSLDGFRENFLQIFQCWGDDDGTNPANPGPPSEQCQFGGKMQDNKGNGAGGFPGGSFAYGRILSRDDLDGFDASQGYLDQETGQLWKPFRAVDGTTINALLKRNDTGQVLYQNTFFNFITTNEIAGGRTFSNGTGSELVEMQTGLEASGLGCGQHVQPVPGQAAKIPKCWIVVVPRGSAATENAGSGREGSTEPINTSPLTAKAWANRIAIPLEFSPVDSSCPVSSEQRRVVGSELAVPAITSWQPVLCAKPGLPPYSYGAISDELARGQLLSGVAGGPGMAVTTRGLDPARLDPDSPPVYAPITLSGTVIGFTIERRPKSQADAAEQQLTGLRVANLNLTPRLVAKLLTQSYKGQLFRGAKDPPPYPWLSKNPFGITEDPDFLQFNPEFAQLANTQPRDLAGLVVEQPRSDAARQVWQWILADREAKAWLAGATDPWGMNVNPYYSTEAEKNTSKVAFADPLPDGYPRNDPYCADTGNKLNSGATALPLCGLDWSPYANSMRDAAQATRVANSLAKTTLDITKPTPETAYVADGPQLQGSRGILTITDSASANRFGLQVAKLSRSNEDTDKRTFIAPDQAGLLAGAAAMRPNGAILETDPSVRSKTGYPLALLTYAVVLPLDLDATSRTDYGAFMRYAAGAGQTPGVAFGQLPLGYAPLPAALRSQTTANAAAVEAADPSLAAPAPDPSRLDDPTAVAVPGGGSPVATVTVPGGAPVVDGLSTTATTGKGAAGSPQQILAAGAKTPVTKAPALKLFVPIVVLVAVLAGSGSLALRRRKPGDAGPA